MTTRLGEIHIPILIIRIEEYGDILVLVKFETNWMVRLREHSQTGTQHMSISCHSYIWNLIVGLKECNEMLILVNYGHNRTVGFSKMRGQSLVKFGQTRSNLVKLNRWSQDHWSRWNSYSNFDHWDWRVWWYIGVGEI